MNLRHDQTGERWVVFIECVSPRGGDEDGDLTGDRVLLFLSLFYFLGVEIIWSENKTWNWFTVEACYFTVNMEIDFRLTQFSVLTKHIG